MTLQMKVCGQKILSKTFCFRWFHPNKNSKTSSNNRDFFVCNMTCSTFAYLTFASRYGHIWLYIMCINNQEGVDMALKRRTRGHIGIYKPGRICRTWQTEKGQHTPNIHLVALSNFKTLSLIMSDHNLKVWQRSKATVTILAFYPHRTYV